MIIQRIFWRVCLIGASILACSSFLWAQAQSEPKQSSLPTIDSACMTFADVLNREASSSFLLSYDNPRKYFGNVLDPMSIMENSPDIPWWILRTKNKILWHGHNNAIKNGILAGGGFESKITEKGYEFYPMRDEMQLALAHEQDISRALGIGTEAKFDSLTWIPICGNHYLFGGFRISSKGIEFLPGTKGRRGDDEQIYIFDGSSWNPVTRE